MADSSTYQNSNSTGTSGVADSIFAQIRKEQYDFMFNWISIVPGYPFNQYYTIKRAHLYYNSKYLGDGGVFTSTNTTGQAPELSTYASQQSSKLFYNVVFPPCEVATRMLNIDTKDIRLWPLNPKSQFSTYLLEKELKTWLKTHTFGQALNKLAIEAPIYGSVVMEKTQDGAEVVDLRRFMLDPTVERVKDSRFVSTVTYMTPSQLRAANQWDQTAVEAAISRFENFNTQEPYEDQFVNVNIMRSTPYIKVFKRYGEVPAYWLDSKLQKGTKAGDTLVRALFIVAGADWVQKNNDGKPVQDIGVVLFKSAWRKEWPFKDFHYTKTRGRWLGIGIVEMLFDVQERVNELKNQKRTSMEISALHLFQTKDKSITRNILTDLQNGDMVISPNGIDPIANEERSMQAFGAEEQDYMQQSDRLTFAFSALRGAAPERREALGLYALQAQEGTSHFAFKKENLGLFLQEFFNDLVLPELLKDLTPEHIMRFTGGLEELEKLDQAASDVFANDSVMKMMLSGQLTLPEHWQDAKQKALQTYKKQGSNRFLKIKQAFYNDAEFEFDFLITGEQADPAMMVKNLQGVIQTVMQFPQVLSDPRLKLLFYKFMEQMGISPAELELADQQAGQQQQLSAPQAGQSNQPMAPGQMMQQGMPQGGPQRQFPRLQALTGFPVNTPQQ